MKKKLTIISLFLAIFIVINAIFSVSIYADDKKLDPSIEGIISSGDDFLKEGKEEFLIPENKVQSVSETIYTTLFIIGTIIAFIVGAILAIKFITGGLEEKAEIKQKLIPYFLGLVALFGAFTIWKIVLNIFQS